MSKVKEFTEERAAYNEILAKYASRAQKTFFGLDAKTYESGSLDKKPKELLGSITIPHVRRAMKIWDEELGGKEQKEAA